MAHDAAESVAPTNYYMKATVSEGKEGGGKGNGWHDEGARQELDVPGSEDMKGKTCCRNARPRQRALVRLGLSSR